MKQKLRKILALLVLSVSVLGLTACGSAKDSETIEYDSAYLQSVSDFLIGSWNGLSEADLDTYATMDEEDAQSMLDSYGLPFTAEAFTTAFAGYEGSMEELGAYVSTDGYEFETKKDEVILITHLTYEQRKADLEIVFNKKSVAQSVTVNPEYSLGEILAKAGMNTLLGMGTVFIPAFARMNTVPIPRSVFAVLILISLVIYCFNFIPNIQAKFGKKKEEKAPAAKPAAAPAAAPVAAPAEPTVDEGELVAAITAAICAYTGSSSDGFVVRSIRRADSATWKRV